MKIETPRLTLRDFTPADGPALHAILGDGEVMAFAEPPYTPAQTQAFWSSSALPAGEAWPAWRKPPASWWATCCFPPWGSRCGSWGGFSAETPGAKALPPRQAGRCFATLSKPSPPGRSSPKPSTPAGLPVCWRNCGFAGKAPAGGIARRGEDPAVSIRPSCQGLGTGKIETAPENSSAVSPCLVRFGEGT